MESGQENININTDYAQTMDRNAMTTNTYLTTQSYELDGNHAIHRRARTLHRDVRDPTTGEVKPSYIFNMFRVKDGKLVEHWDVSPGMASPPAGAPAGPGAAGAR